MAKGGYGSDASLIQAAMYAGMAGVPKDLSKIYGDVGAAYAKGLEQVGEGYKEVAKLAAKQGQLLYEEHGKQFIKRQLNVIGVDKRIAPLIEGTFLEVGSKNMPTHPEEWSPKFETHSGRDMQDFHDVFGFQDAGSASDLDVQLYNWVVHGETDEESDKPSFFNDLEIGDIFTMDGEEYKLTKKVNTKDEDGNYDAFELADTRGKLVFDKKAPSSYFNSFEDFKKSDDNWRTVDGIVKIGNDYYENHGVVGADETWDLRKITGETRPKTGSTYVDSNGNRSRFSFKSFQEQVEHLNELQKNADTPEEKKAFREKRRALLDNKEQFEQAEVFFDDAIDNKSFLDAPGEQDYIQFARAIKAKGNKLEDGSYIMQGFNKAGEMAITWLDANGKVKKITDRTTGKLIDATVKPEDLQKLLIIKDVDYIASTATLDTQNLTSGGTAMYDPITGALLNTQDGAYDKYQRQKNVNVVYESVGSIQAWENAKHHKDGNMEQSYMEFLHGVKDMELHPKIFNTELWSTLDVDTWDKGFGNWDGKVDADDFQTVENYRKLVNHLSRFTPENRQIFAGKMADTRYRKEWEDGVNRIKESKKSTSDSDDDDEDWRNTFQNRDINSKNNWTIATSQKVNKNDLLNLVNQIENKETINPLTGFNQDAGILTWNENKGGYEDEDGIVFKNLDDLLKVLDGGKDVLNRFTQFQDLESPYDGTTTKSTPETDEEDEELTLYEHVYGDYYNTTHGTLVTSEQRKFIEDNSVKFNETATTFMNKFYKNPATHPSLFATSKTPRKVKKELKAFFKQAKNRPYILGSSFWELEELEDAFGGGHKIKKYFIEKTEGQFTYWYLPEKNVRHLVDDWFDYYKKK